MQTGSGKFGAKRGLKINYSIWYQVFNKMVSLAWTQEQIGQEVKLGYRQLFLEVWERQMCGKQEKGSY